MKASPGNRIRTIVLANCILCILVQFRWLGYASVHGLPVSQKFLMWRQSRRVPAFGSVLIGPALLAGYFAARRKPRQLARIMAAVVGMQGVYLLAALVWPVLVLRPGPPQVFDADMALGIYSGLSYAALAVFWRRRGPLPMFEQGTPRVLGAESDASQALRPPNRETYTPEQVTEFQQAFGPVAQRYRRSTRIALLAYIAGFGLLLLSTLGNAVATFVFDQPFQAGLPDILSGGMAACFVLGIVFWGSKPHLFCPACGADLEEDIEEAVVVYCPECGSDRLRADFLDRTKCEACGKTLWSGKFGGRRHRTRACHICGLTLDTRGV
jgi:ribosomal protein S27AE